MNQGTAILEVRDASVRFGGLSALQRVSIKLQEGAVSALIGPNGAGKSTLLNAVSGFCPLTSGSVTFRGRDITRMAAHDGVATGMARTFQDLEVMQRLTVAENVLLGFQDQSAERLATLLFRPLRARRDHRATVQKAMGLLGRVGLEERADVLASELSYGEQKLLVVARLLATDAELLMLDEPGAGLPATNIHEIGRLLRETVAEGKTVLLVDHNMDLVMTYADHVTVLHHGQVIATGSPAEIKADQRVADVYLGSHRDEGTKAREPR